MDGFLLLSFLFLVAGVIAVPIASRLGLGSVLGYLLAGIALSPLLHQLGVDVISIQHFAEFGVVMMLFLVGLELEPRMLWQMKTKLLGLGGLQVGLTTVAVTGVAMLFGQPWSIALAIGLVLALSSTAIVLQTLNEKGLMRSDGGQASFSVLLFQDIAVIPMLAFIPLLALPELADSLQHAVGADAQSIDDNAGHNTASASGGHGEHSAGDDHGPKLSLVDSLPVWQSVLVTLAAIGVVVVGGTVLTRPIFHFIAMAKLRELFTASALLLMIGIALLMTVVGLSPALGTFLAGVVLANSEYRHELESNIAPFKGLLLGLFFITVGAGINFGLLAEHFFSIVGMTLGLIVLKASILLLLAIVFKIRGANRWLFALGLAQAGEFGFVLLSFTVSNAVLPTAITDQLLLVVALSMLLTPGLFIVYEKIIAPRYFIGDTGEADEIDEHGSVIIAGHGRFGGIVNRILLSSGHKTVVLDHQSDHLNMLRAFGLKVYFGDASRPDLLHAAGIDDAKMLVIAIGDPEQAVELVRYVKKNHPQVHVVVGALNRTHVYELYAAGADDIIREHFDSAVRAGRSALEALGVHPYDAERQTRRFVENDLQALRELAELYDPSTPTHKNTAYVERTKEVMAMQEAAMCGKTEAFGKRFGRDWAPPTLRDVQAVRESDEQSNQA